jgi:hypothetical protein
MQPYMGLGNSLQTAQGGSAAGVGGWVELARTTLGSAGDDIDVTGLADKRYLMILCDTINTGGSTNLLSQLNADTGTNYAVRESDNGGSDGSGGNRTTMNFTGSSADNQFAVGYLSNLSTKEKLLIGWGMGSSTAGAGSAPRRRELNAKYAETTNPITSFKMFNNEAGSYNTGSEVVVLGWDPADTHTTNFWEELANTNAAGSTENMNTGTFTAKKYLWVQMYLDPDAAYTSEVIFNSDSGSNYAYRYSDNGAADASGANQAQLSVLGETSTPFFTNLFIINNSANEKLVHWNTVGQSTAGAGTAPIRQEGVGKWANTSSQITRIDVNDVTGTDTLSTSSQIVVWGSD